MEFFASSEKQEILKKELDEWLGTPFMHRCGVKKAGTDCIHFVIRVLENVGAIPKTIIPEYAKDWALHRTEEVMIKSFRNLPQFKEIGFNDMKNGDIIAFQYGRACSHVGIYFNNDIYEAMNNRKVEKMSWFDTEKQTRKKYCFRVITNG